MEGAGTDLINRFLGVGVVSRDSSSDSRAYMVHLREPSRQHPVLPVARKLSPRCAGAPARPVYNCNPVTAEAWGRAWPPGWQIGRWHRR